MLATLNVACGYSLQTKEVSVPGWNVPFQLHFYTNCETRDVVYVTVCPCKLLYMGMCRRPLKIRILEHLVRICNKVMEAPLTAYYLSAGHSPEDLWGVFCFKISTPSV